VDELHGKEGPAIAQIAHLVNGRNARMLQLPGDLRFLQKTLLQFGLPQMAFQHHLDGQGASQLRIAGPQDATHAAASDLPKQQVSPGVSWLGQRRGDRSRSGKNGADEVGVVRQSLLVFLDTNRADRVAFSPMCIPTAAATSAGPPFLPVVR
jgi:hypothetical protein